MAERNQLEHRQMKFFFAERPQAKHYKRITTMWVRWADSNGMLYSKGWQATMLRMEELVDRTHNIEYAPTMILQKLLPPNHDLSESLDEPMADDFPGSDNSGEE